MMTIFFIWLVGNMSESYKQRFEDCKVNYGDCRIVTEDEEARLLKKYDKYNPNNTVIERADVLRLLNLYQHGGIYLDLDVQVNNWDFLRTLNCENTTFFSEEQISVLNEQVWKVSNWFICSGKGTPEMKRLIDGLAKEHHANPDPQEVLAYAGPTYLRVMNASYITTYPNLKHCYDNNWTNKRQGCVTPLYSYRLYFGNKCFYLMGVVYLVGTLAFIYIRRYLKARAQASESSGVGSRIEYDSEQFKPMNANVEG